MRNQKTTRFLALFLAAVMVIGYIPTYAFATETEESQETDTAFVEETEAVTEAAEETEAAETTETEQTGEEATEAATEEATEAATEEATEETTQPEEDEEYDFPDVDSMTDAELLAYYAGLSDEEAEAFALSLTDKQLERLSDLLYAVELCGESSDTHTVFKNTQSTLAPGVTQNIKYAYAADGKQMAYYIATADVTRDDVVVQTSYYKQHENGVMGMAKLTEQIEYAIAKYTNKEDPLYISDYYNVVAGVNSSFYNMQSGQPLGITYIDGVSFGTDDYDNFFAILKDGKTAVIDYASNLSKYVDDNGESTIWQAAAGSQWLVRDGEDVTAGVSGDYNTTRHSRTCVGVTAEGKVVLMVLDGRQEPFSCGGTMHELAQIMLEAGCVTAINLDGGGSTTFASKAEGANAVSVINRPSDGSERSISAGIIIASTTAPSNVFDHVSMVAADEYVTPGTSTEITLAGVSPAGTTAEIPADVTYTVTNGTYENGVLTAGEAGDVVLTAQYGGKDVGSVTIHCVIPETISFSAETITVPYGKSLELEMSATYGLNEVKTKVEDFLLALENENAGALEGLTFTACEETTEIKSTKITATFVGVDTLTATATLTMGKGSEILWDFEDGDISDWTRKNKSSYNYILTPGSVSLSSAADGGIVHSGDYALRFNMDFSVSTEGGYMSGLLGLNNEEVIDLGGATSFGMWLYCPIEAKSLNGRIYLRQVTERNEDGSIKSYDKSTNSTDATMDGNSNWNVGFVTQFEESGWHYISFDLTTNGELGYCIPENAVLLDIYINDRDNTEYNYNHLNYKSLNQNVIMYVDDVTLDYSSVVDDREAPIFSGVTYADTTMSDAATLSNKATLTGSIISFSANVAENTRKDNATGLDESTVKAYVDGRQVSYTFDGNKITVADTYLVNGNHTVKFSICDKQGNYASIIRTFTVNASGNNSASVKLEPHDASLDKILLGSVYYVDVVATNVETTSTVVVDLDLNNISVWELDHMEVAEGFKASYSIINSEENIARISITRTKATEATGEMALVSMPIRTWELPCVVCDGGTGKKGQYATYEMFKKGSETWPIDIQVTVVSGLLNGSTSFAGDTVQVDTESYVWDNATKPAEYATWNGGHDHRAWTKDYYSASSTNHVDAVALEDKAATCTESGYTGRTYCEVCHSVVTWGTTIPATGHTYELTDGVLKCHCGENFTGTWTDGKEYVDGVAQADGWVGDSYYLDGTKVTGIHKVPAADGSGEFYYDFGEDGISTGKYTGLFLDETEQVYRYAKIGELVAGWVMIDDNWHYFHGGTYAASAGTYKVGDVKYEFDETGKIATGVWARTLSGTRYYYGPTYYQKGWQTIDGNRYFFQNGYRYEGKRIVHESNNTDLTWYDFGTDGICRDMTDGLYRNEDGLYYILNGLSQRGLWKIDGAYYFFRYDGTAVTGSVYAYETHCDLKCDTYYFGQDCKMVNGIVETEDGIYCYSNGKKASAGLTKLGDDYYFVGSDAKCATGTKYAWATNCDLPCDTYEFGADGKMLNGIVEKADGVYYYTNGKVDGSSVGLNKIGDAYYFIGSNGKCAVGVKYAWKTNCDLKCDTYEFGADGKMCSGIVMKEDGPYYYTNGKGGVEVVGLNKVGEDYYFISYGGKCSVGSKYAWATNCDLPCNTYEFGADGKMLRGLVQKDDGLYYYVNGRIDGNAAGLTKIGEDYYFIGSNGKCATGTKYAWATNCNLPCTTYEFGADGKMLQGIVEKSNGIYYYINGQTGRQQVGLIRVGEDYYFVNSDGKCATGTKYAWETSCDLPCDTYEFGADGKMLQGLVEKDGNLYLYVNGKLGGDRAGLTKLGEDYYFIGSSGQCATGTKYAWKTNCDLPCDTYEFGTDGKMLRGFITRENGIYYYDNGKLAQTGLHFIDGYYYCVKSDGTLVVSQSYYVWQTNDLLIEDTYTFNEYGQIIG